MVVKFNFLSQALMQMNIKLQSLCRMLIIPAIKTSRTVQCPGQHGGYDVFYEEVPHYAHEWDFWDLSLRKALDEWLPIRHDVILAGSE